LTNSQRLYSDDIIQAFKSISNYIRHKAIGNVNTVMLAMDLYKSYSDITTMDMVPDSVDSISLMLNRSYEIQSIFELSESKSSIKEIFKMLQKRIFSSEKHTDSDLDLFIANEILKAHEIKMHLEENHPKGGVLILKLDQRDFSIK